MNIPFNKPHMTGKELWYIAQAHANGHLAGDGNFTRQCSRWLEARTGASKALLTHSCTAALEMAAILAEAQSADPWTSRARPAFLYVIYTLLLWSIPMGLIAATQPAMAENIARGMNAYLAGIPEPLYTLFGTGYLGYTAARTWGKIRGVDK